MMARKVLFICVLIIPLILGMVIIPNIARAEDEDSYGFDTADIQYENSPVNKLGRGLINTATCWAEIPGEVARVSNETNPAIGFTLGVVQGTINTLIRGAMGIVDTLTFFAPPYDKPMMKPEYALVSADENIKNYLW
jgi:putative exosortase-associated protein (TIGR04073 family)